MHLFQQPANPRFFGVQDNIARSPAIDFTIAVTSASDEQSSDHLNLHLFGSGILLKNGLKGLPQIVSCSRYVKSSPTRTDAIHRHC